MPPANILICEDEAIVAMDIQMRLKEAGYSVCGLAPSGEAAIRKATEMRPDLVLMDIRLKGTMDGVDAARQIRARLDVPVVYLTAFADDNTLQRAKLTEPYGYIIKPFEERDLHTSVEIALYKHKMEKKLKESEQWLATTLRSIGEAVIATDVESRVRFMNPVAEALVGWSLQEALHRDISEVFQANVRPTATSQNVMIKMGREGVRIGEDRAMLVTKDGTEVPISGTGAPIRDDRGRILGLIIVFRDVTEEQKAEDQKSTGGEHDLGEFTPQAMADDLDELLGGLLSHIEQGKAYAQPGTELWEHLMQADTASRRVKDLAQRWLAHSIQPTSRPGGLS
jgi:two-component system, cell cycle sensor histidine kinase and response regulator CckA